MSGNRNNEYSGSLLLTTPTPDDRERERQRQGEASTSTSRRFRTLLYLLTSDKSDADADDGDDPSLSRWRAFKERLGFTLLGCCSGGAAPRRRSSSPSPPPPEENLEDENGVVVIDLQETQEAGGGAPGGGMNLAEALEAEREFRASVAESPERVSLMRLLEAAEREREAEEAEAEEVVVGEHDRLCCVCMVRRKGAAIIPCGHTFCRVCTKEVRVNRGSCPLCNRHIVDVLKIF